jgi:hypothetical protein
MSIKAGPTVLYSIGCIQNELETQPIRVKSRRVLAKTLIQTWR